MKHFMKDLGLIWWRLWMRKV